VFFVDEKIFAFRANISVERYYRNTAHFHRQGAEDAETGSSMQEAGCRRPTARCHLRAVYLRLGGELTKRRWACNSLKKSKDNVKGKIFKEFIYLLALTTYYFL
jgi:hypothetical protein